MDEKTLVIDGELKIEHEIDGEITYYHGIDVVGTAVTDDVLEGKTFMSMSAHDGDVGTMTNNGAVNGRVATKNGLYVVPKGYHDGHGVVGIAESEKDKLVGINLRRGMTILGVDGTGNLLTGDTVYSVPTNNLRLIFSGLKGVPKFFVVRAPMLPQNTTDPYFFIYCYHTDNLDAGEAYSEVPPTLAMARNNRTGVTVNRAPYMRASVTNGGSIDLTLTIQSSTYASFYIPTDVSITAYKYWLYYLY